MRTCDRCKSDYVGVLKKVVDKNDVDCANDEGFCSVKCQKKQNDSEDKINIERYKLSLIEKIQNITNLKQDLFDFVQHLEGQTLFAWCQASASFTPRFRKVKISNVIKRSNIILLKGECENGDKQTLTLRDIRVFEDV